MKYYFSDNCYWDDNQSCIFRDEQIVKLPESQSIILAYLIQNRDTHVTPAQLYLRMTKGDPPDRDPEYRVRVSQKFTRDKGNERGLLTRVPEIEKYWSKSRTGDGWYMLSIPAENIFDDDQQIVDFEDYSEIWHSKKYFDTMSKRARADDPKWLAQKFRRYLQGDTCIWELPFSDSSTSPVRRVVIDKLRESINDGSGAIVLTGAGGEGKTTILMQLCVELYRQGITVLYHAPTYKFDFPDNLRKCVFIVDNPTGSREFRSFLFRAVREGLTVVMAARSNEWNVIADSLSDDIRRTIREIEIPRLTASEATDFAACVKRSIHGISRTEAELKTLFQKESYGFLYASMLMATHDSDSLEDIAYQIIKRICEYDKSRPTLKILAAIVFCEKCNVLVGTRLFRFLCRTFSIDERDPKRYLRMEISLNGSTYQTRHETISNLFYRFLFTESGGKWWNYLNYDEQENVTTALLEYHFSEIGKRPGSGSVVYLYASNIASLLINSFRFIDDMDTRQYLLQRLFESCRQNNTIAIDRVFHMLDDFEDRHFLAEKCYDAHLPLWEIYCHWISDMMESADNSGYVETHLEYLCLCLDAPEQVWRLWAQHEENKQNSGTWNQEKTAQWIYKTGCERIPQAHNLWLKWGESAEHLNNIGDYDTVGSSAWIWKNACMKDNITEDASLWIKWAAFVKRYPQMNENSKPSRYSASSILKTACIDRNINNSQIWGNWAREEENLGNIGDYNTPYSAAWIYRKGCEEQLNNDHTIWLWWSIFMQNHDISVSESTCREITTLFEKVCLEYNLIPEAWIAWAVFQETRQEIGDCLSIGSAAWIYKTANEKHKHAHLTLRWAQFVYRHNSVFDQHRSLSAIEILKNAEKDVPVLTNPLWNELESFKQIIGYYNT